MGIKVVKNSCYGGFSISKKCAERMAELGSKEAKELLASKSNHDVLADGSVMFYGYLSQRYPRHCPALVQAVTELGEDADGDAADLHVLELSGDRYIIRAYDGLECVLEPKDINWIIVQ